MTRAFTPPDTLSNDEIKTIADVRREIWTQAFQGLLVGSFSGFGLHMLAKFGNNRGFWKLSTNRNTALLSVLLGGALGSFVNATTTGKNEVHNLHPIFQVGAKPPPIDYSQSNSPYQKQLEEMRQREIELQILESRRDRTATEQEYLEKARREKNRLYRRESLSQSLQKGQHGLSDSHGGHWVENGTEDEEDESQKEQR